MKVHLHGAVTCTKHHQHIGAGVLHQQVLCTCKVLALLAPCTRCCANTPHLRCLVLTPKVLVHGNCHATATCCRCYAPSTRCRHMSLLVQSTSRYIAPPSVGPALSGQYVSTRCYLRSSRTKGPWPTARHTFMHHGAWPGPLAFGQGPVDGAWSTSHMLLVMHQVLCTLAMAQAHGPGCFAASKPSATGPACAAKLLQHAPGTLVQMLLPTACTAFSCCCLCQAHCASERTKRQHQRCLPRIRISNTNQCVVGTKCQQRSCSTFGA